MEMTDDSLNSRLKGIADEIKTDDMSIIKKPMISFNDDLKPTEYTRRIGECTGRPEFIDLIGSDRFAAILITKN